MKKILALICCAFLVGSCATPQPETPEAAAMVCVFQSNREAKVFGEFKGQKVGFCCNNCQAKWNGLMDKKKDQLFASYDK